MATTVLEPKVAPGRSIRQLDSGVWTSLTDDFLGAPYDLRAQILDIITSSPSFHRFFWGVSTDSYVAFAHEAFSEENMPYLDAGCGTMCFTADVYAGVEEPVVGVDLSRGMLEKARARLGEIRPEIPARIELVQGDLMDLPFAPGSFDTVLCMGMAHMFGDLDRLIVRLSNLLHPGGELYLTSLVSGDRPIGETFGKFLLDRGEIRAWRDAESVAATISHYLNVVKYWTEGNVAFYWAVKQL